jgi:ABC-type microcin C transport system duplicated ATPase subunit YejF
MVKEVWKRITHPFTPSSLITFAHAIGDKEQITANFYFKEAGKVHEFGKEMRSLFDAAEADFKAKLVAAKAEADKETAAKEAKAKVAK